MEGTADQVKWEELDFTEPRHSVGVGCFPDQVVSIVQECTDGGTLVQTREGIPYQLSGVTGGNSSCQNIPEKPGKQTCTVVNRQSNGSCIHKQPGWDSLRPSDNPGERALDVVPGEGHPTLGSISSRRGKHQGRHRVTGDEGLLRLDAEPSDIPEDSGSLPRP